MIHSMLNSYGTTLTLTCCDMFIYFIVLVSQLQNLQWWRHCAMIILTSVSWNRTTIHILTLICNNTCHDRWPGTDDDVINSSSLLLLMLFLFFFFFFFFFVRSPAISLGFTTFGWDFCVCDRFLIQPLRQSHSVFVDGACWVCFCCWHSPV